MPSRAVHAWCPSDVERDFLVTMSALIKRLWPDGGMSVTCGYNGEISNILLGHPVTKAHDVKDENVYDKPIREYITVLLIKGAIPELGLQTAAAWLQSKTLISSIRQLTTARDIWRSTGFTPPGFDPTHPLLDPRRTYMTLLVLAKKFCLDTTRLRNNRWARLTGLSLKEIARCEWIMLEELDWKLRAGPEFEVEPPKKIHKEAHAGRKSSSLKRPVSTTAAASLPQMLFVPPYPKRASHGNIRPSTSSIRYAVPPIGTQGSRGIYHYA